PLDGVTVSLSGSHVAIDGWRLKSLNHSHAVRSSGTMSSSMRSLALTPHLHSSVLAEQRFRGSSAIRCALHPHPVLAVAEARIVADHHRQTWNPRMDEQAGDSRERANEHHDLESEDRVRNPRSYRLAANHQRPIVGCPDRDPVAEGNPAQAPDQRIQPHG